tara:strand:+ start:1073 stop:1342 length:270 start_codon:yes stop_codon:yes gene_type:complete
MRTESTELNEGEVSSQQRQTAMVMTHAIFEMVTNLHDEFEKNKIIKIKKSKDLEKAMIRRKATFKRNQEDLLKKINHFVSGKKGAYKND